GVALVAVVLLGQDVLQWHLFAVEGQVLLPAERALVRAGGEKELALGVRKGDGSLIASLGDDVGTTSQLPLQLDEKRPHQVIAGNELRVVRDGRAADFASHVVAVDEHLTALKLKFPAAGGVRDGLLVLQ